MSSDALALNALPTYTPRDAAVRLRLRAVADANASDSHSAASAAGCQSIGT